MFDRKYIIVKYNRRFPTLAAKAENIASTDPPCVLRIAITKLYTYVYDMPIRIKGRDDYDDIGCRYPTVSSAANNRHKNIRVVLERALHL